MILPNQYRIGPEHRVHISPWKNIATWQTLASQRSQKFQGVELRVVPRPSTEYYKYAQEKANELGMACMFGSAGSPLSHVSGHSSTSMVDRSLLHVRLKRYFKFGAM